MTNSHLVNLVAFLGICFWLSFGAMAGQTQPSAEAQLRAAMNRYNALILKHDDAAIAALFAPNGELVVDGQTIRGPKAIREFLGAFKDVKVASNKTAIKSVKVNGNQATVLGSFRQRAILPGGKAVNASGGIKAEFVRQGDGRWLVQRMSTQPAS